LYKSGVALAVDRPIDGDVVGMIFTNPFVHVNADQSVHVIVFDAVATPSEILSVAVTVATWFPEVVHVLAHVAVFAVVLSSNVQAYAKVLDGCPWVEATAV
jgi:hypothetical protein